ncbi:Zn(2)-C6 fungal-type DNA-binding domain protein [Metarhizium robertsii ARSEF 23]|uniref:Zn(2)-C6 fungal-type DNA-binding domain protein n=1 Tax=Metarhizium robertsii (strain ARSEF 23 / ATCC MYA-3075) TaxID=655844 RepID=E9ETR5_METRA|nr:Zn(2)-C6 fungal-type DNA-binding domain protein [Metarhizium robertsii ARSEF 23]EFZ00818.2 Zn(2)-C6 fungal-type DNA-binding domain protein [Metarhizium robertsii ARSEF 23]
MNSKQPSGQGQLPTCPKPSAYAPSAPFNGQSNRSIPPRAFIRPKRAMISVACQNCRRRKAKCNGSRPTCKRCHSRGESCTYELERGKALTSVLKQKRDDLMNENEQYRELFQLLCTKPKDEALELFRRIRESGEPFIVFEAVRQAEVLFPNHSPSETYGSYQLERLDRLALDGSIIKVPARPWTIVAGDGLVSELITNLFHFNGTYLLPVLEKDVFIEDMKSGHVIGSRYCTPFLVNAICAVESNFSERAKQFGVIAKQNLSDRFFEEAKRLYEREQGCASIPNIVALVLMYLTMAIKGRDKISRIYLYTAYALLNRLSLEEKFQALESRPGSQKEKCIISRVLWGLYIMESRIAFYYSHPSILPAPKVPKPPDEFGTANMDVLGRLYDEATSAVPLVPGINTINCNLTELWNDLMQYICQGAITGSDTDLRSRKSFYCMINPKTRTRISLSPNPKLARMHETEIIFTILRDVPLDTPFHNLYDLPGTTVRDILRKRCIADVELIGVYMNKWQFLGGLAYRHIHLCMYALIPFLDDSATHPAFSTACMIAQQGISRMKVLGYLLQGIQAFAWAMGKTIPESARRYLHGWGVEAIEPDLPVSFVLPQPDNVKEALARNSGSLLEEVESQLGSLIELWARLGQ